MASIVNITLGETYDNPIDIAIPAVAAGNTVVCIAYIPNSNAPASVTDNGGASPTYAEDHSFAIGFEAANFVYFRRSNVTDGPTQVSINLASPGLVKYWVYEISGLDNTSPVGQTEGPSSGTSTTPAVSFTTATAGELGIMVTMLNNSTTQSGANGWAVSPGTDSYSFTAYDEDLGAAGAKSTDVTLGASRGWASGITTYLAAGGTAAGVSTETDTALALVAVQLQTVGVATETATALALVAVQSQAAGVAAEIDASTALLAVQLQAAGAALESDAALALVPSSDIVASETDTAIALSVARPVGLATETDSASTPVLAFPVGMALEINTAMRLTRTITVPSFRASILAARRPGETRETSHPRRPSALR